jgi:hypothetical protein
MLAPAAFVVGSPRSGTTLLRVMPAGHSQLFSPPELVLAPFATMAERQASLDVRWWGPSTGTRPVRWPSSTPAGWTPWRMPWRAHARSRRAGRDALRALVDGAAPDTAYDGGTIGSNAFAIADVAVTLEGSADGKTALPACTDPEPDWVGSSFAGGSHLDSDGYGDLAVGAQASGWRGS